MWGKRHIQTLLVEWQIGATTLESRIEVPQKTWNRPTIWPSYPTPCFTPKGLKISILQWCSHINVHSCSIHKSYIMESAKMPSIIRWIKKLQYIYTMEYYSAREKNTTMAFVGKWMRLEKIMLSEIGQFQKTKGQMFSLISGWWYKKGGIGGRKRRMKELWMV